MADEKEPSILDDVRAAASEVAGEPVERETPELEAPVEQAPVETAQQTADRQRDEAGRFKAKADGEKRETLTLKDKAVTQPATEAATTTAPVKDGAKPLEGLEIPPVNWKGSAKISWGKLPAPVRQELVEQHARVAAAEAEIVPLKEMIDLNRESMVRHAGSVNEGMRQLFAFHEMSLTKPLDLIQHIAQSRGIDLRALFGGQQGTQPGTQPQQPDIQAIIDRTVQQRLQPFQAQIEQRENQQLQSTIDAFRSDPKHPYFEDVKAHMGQLLKVGAAKDMQDAYDQAIWANPAIRTQLLAEQAEEAKRNNAAEAQKARLASRASLRGSPIPGATSGQASQGSSVLDDVRAAAAELSGA